MYEWALFFHLVGAFAFFSGLAIAVVGQTTARNRPRPSEISLLLRVARWGVVLVGSGSLLVLVSGFWLLDLTEFGVGGWVFAALALLGFALVTGGIGGQAPKRARRLADELAQEGDVLSRELVALLHSRAADVLNGVAAAATIAILVLMVWKPGA